MGSSGFPGWFRRGRPQDGCSSPSKHPGANTSARVPSFSQSRLVQPLASMLAPLRSAAGYPLVLGASLDHRDDLIRDSLE